MYIVKRTLQTRDPKTKEPIYYTASNTPQKLPADIAKEAVTRGFAVKVEAEKKPAKKAAAKKTELVNSGLQNGAGDQTDDEIDFEAGTENSTEPSDE